MGCDKNPKKSTLLGIAGLRTKGTVFCDLPWRMSGLCCEEDERLCPRGHVSCPPTDTFKKTWRAGRTRLRNLPSSSRRVVLGVGIVNMKINMPVKKVRPWECVNKRGVLCCAVLCCVDACLRQGVFTWHWVSHQGTSPPPGRPKRFG